MILANHLKAVVSFGKTPHAEGVEFDDADILDRFSIKLCRDAAMFILEEWQVIGEGFV